MDLNTLLAIEQHGDLNPAQRTELERLKRENPNIGINGVFNFDFEKAAKDAFGELGPYYLELLTQSQGDLNKVLTRLAEDYDTGRRARGADNIVANQATERGNVANMLARGLYQRSNFTQNPLITPLTGEYQNPQDQGFGIADLINPNNASGNTIRQRNTEGIRTNDQALISKERSIIDATEEQRRKTLALEEERKQKSADLAQTRGARAYNAYAAKIAANPTLV